MKQLLILLLCCLCSATYAQQTYIRNYSTFTEYGTIPAATIPSSRSTNYNTQPAYEYKAPEKSEEDIAKDAWHADLKETKEQLNLYYTQKDYNSVIAICKDYESRYPDGSVYPDIGVYMASAYMHTGQYEVLADKLGAKYQYFGDRHDFDLAAADVLQQYGYYERAAWYYKLAVKANQKLDGYELGYSVTAARQGEIIKSESVFLTLMRATDNDPGNYYNRALAFLNAKNSARDLAIQDLVIFVTKTTETLDAYLLMAKIYAAKGNSELCITAAKEYLKLHESEECKQLIAKAEAEIADRPRKAALALAEEQKRKEAAALLAQQQQEQKIKDDARMAERVSNEREAFKILEEEYMKYIEEHDVYDPQSAEYSGKIKYTNMDEAIKRGDFKSFFILFKQNTNKLAYFGIELRLALEEDEYDIAKFLIENNCDLTATGQDAMTLLHLVCYEYYLADYYTPPADNVVTHDVELAKLLIEKGADVNNIDKNRKTPLHYAACTGNLAMVKLLLEHNVKPFSIVWPYAETPLQGVMKLKNKNKEIIKLLKEHDPPK